MQKDYDNHNIFARILRGEIPCKAVYESPTTLAIHDIRPAAPVHIVVFPKEAYVDYDDFIVRAPADEVVAFARDIHAILQQLGLIEGGYRLVTNQGRVGGQEVPHFHLHILAGSEPLGPLLSGA